VVSGVILSFLERAYSLGHSSFLQRNDKDTILWRINAVSTGYCRLEKCATSLWMV